MGKENLYCRVIKPAIGRLLAAIGLILFSWLYLLIAIAIIIDDGRPVLFKQRRVGKKKDGQYTYFNILKFRTMKNSTPKDVPTHLLENPEQYITRVGKFLRRTSLDEIPQLWNIAVEGTICWIGPRPALYNQEDLLEEREKYGANDVTPGITGWAQINGRDELEIPEKARLDGVYVKDLHQSSMHAFLMDVTCLKGTMAAVAMSSGVHEGAHENVHTESEKAEDDQEDDLLTLKGNHPVEDDQEDGLLSFGGKRQVEVISRAI